MNLLILTATDPVTGKVVVLEQSLGALEGVGRFAANQGLQNSAQTAISQALGMDVAWRDVLRNTALSTLNATAFNAVGDYSKLQDWQEGGFEKVALHAVTGGLLSEVMGSDFKTGALAAGLNESLQQHLSGITQGDKNSEILFAQLIGLSTAAVTGGDLQQTVELTKNATAYNRQLHSKEAQLLDELAAKDPARQKEWEAAACALVECSAGVSPSDPDYQDLVNLQAQGAQYPELQASLKQSGLFTYTSAEQLRDAFDYRAQEIYTLGAWGNTLLGGATAVGSGVAGAGGCIATAGLGCAFSAGIGTVGVMGGIAQYHSGINQLNTPYVSSQGQRVIDSFSRNTHPGYVTPWEGVGNFIVSFAADQVLDRVGGKAIEPMMKMAGGAKGVGVATTDMPKVVAKSGAINPANVRFSQSSIKGHSVTAVLSMIWLLSYEVEQ